MIVRYDMLCRACQHVWEEVCKSGETEGWPCPKCGSTETAWLPSCQVQPEFKPVFHEHLSNEGVMLTSRQQYREELKKRNLRGPYWHGDNITEI